MDAESSTKFIGSLTKFLQSLCNGYVEFDDGVELIGHIYLSVDAGKTGKTLNYFLNEKVCKNDNSVTFISNSFHAQPDPKSKGKEGESRKEDGEVSDSGDNIPRSSNAGTASFRPQGSRSGASPNQIRTGMPAGSKRPGSPLKGPPSQRRAPTPPSQRRFLSSGPRGTVGSPVSKTVPSSPSSSSQDNTLSPSPARKSRSELSQPASNQSDNAGADNENDIPSNVLSINPTPEFASFLGSLTSDNQTSQDQHSPPDTKPDTDVTFIKEEFVSEPSSCAQAGSSGQQLGRSGEDSSGLYPVMLHQNTSVFPGTSFSGYQGGASSTATSQQPAFPGSSQSDSFNPVPGTSQDGADPSGCTSRGPVESHSGHTVGSDSYASCGQCSSEFSTVKELDQHYVVWHSDCKAGHSLPEAGHTAEGPRPSRRKKMGSAIVSTEQQADDDLALHSSKALEEDLPVCFNETSEEPINLDGEEEGACEPSGESDGAVAGLAQHLCPVCQKTFRYSFNLRRHLNTHMNYFQHACFICGRGFHRSDFMLRHVRTVHKNIIGADSQAH